MHIHKEEERRSYPKEAGETRPQGLTSLPGRIVSLCHSQSSKANTNMNLALLHCILFELQLALHAQGFNHQTRLKTQLAPQPPRLCCCPAAVNACAVPRDHQPRGLCPVLGAVWRQMSVCYHFLKQSISHPHWSQHRYVTEQVLILLPPSPKEGTS